MYDELVKDLRENHDKYFARDMQAADAIERLDAIAQTYVETVHEIEDKRKWIPVTERLPEDRNMVLATVDGVVRIAFYGNYMWEEIETYSIFYPTHWMPIPQPPKDGES